MPALRTQDYARSLYIFGGSYGIRNKAEAKIPRLESELWGIYAGYEEKADIESDILNLMSKPVNMIRCQSNIMIDN